MKQEKFKLWLLLISTLLSGYVIGAMQGVVIFLFDPENYTPVLPISRGSIDLLEWSILAATAPFFLALFAFIPGIRLTHKVFGDKIGMLFGAIFMIGWAIAIGPFFYVFRMLPQ